MAKVETLAAQEQSSSVKKMLRRGGSISFLINSSGMALALLMQVMLARMLGAAAYGTYAFVSTVVTFLVFPTKLGFDTSIVRLVASYRAMNEWGFIKGLLRRANQIGLVLSMTAMIMGAVFLIFSSDSMTTERIVTYAAGLATIPLLTLATLRQSVLQALKDVLFSQMPEKIARPIITMAILACWIGVFGIKADAGVAMISFAAAVAISWLIGAVVLRKRIGSQIEAIESRYDTRSWTKLSVSLMLNAGMYLILGQLGVLMMGMMHSETESGLFSAAVRLATLAAFALTAVNMTAAPMLSELYATGKRKQLQHVCQTSGLSGFVFAAMLMIAFAAFGKLLLGLFGAEFRASYWPMLIMTFGQVVNAYCGQNGMMATMTGRQNALTKALIVSTVLNIALNVALIPLMGMTGAAIATTAGLVCWNVIMVVFVYRKMGILTVAWLPKRAWNRLLEAAPAEDVHS
ncbi:flippase [Paenibacillus mendelii]|uniref:Flippase n=1 Tax=Paenibacillus mendelii TaxID=206163 RepID=A0ABV6J4X9_9BACL|nr:flippase [Paenibacillus mendelii]MCQ6560437.1 flippase [Paenibacillus mendelii]